MLEINKLNKAKVKKPCKLKLTLSNIKMGKKC
jgi:hypothetical protein